MKNLTANARDARDAGSILRSGRSLKKEMASYSSILAWKILWTGIWWATVHSVAKSRTSEHACVPSPR